MSLSNVDDKQNSVLKTEKLHLPQITNRRGAWSRMRDFARRRDSRSCYLRARDILAYSVRTPRRQVF